MSTVCFHYGIYGHLKDICPLLQRHDPAPLVQTETPLPEPRVTNSVPDENFGPWMLVERRTHNSRGLNPTNQASKESLQITPTLDPIFESIENLHDPLPNSWANVSKLVLATNDQSDSPEIAITDAPLVSTPSRQLFDKPKSAGKSTGNAQKVSSVHLVARKSTVTSIKVGCQSHGTSKTSLHGSRTPTHQHDVFSSSMPLVSLLSHSNSGPPTVILDPSRHQAIQLRDNDHPCIPIEAVTSDHYAHESELMGSLVVYGSVGMAMFILISSSVTSNLFIVESIVCPLVALLLLPLDRDFITAVFNSGFHDLGYQGLDFTCASSSPNEVGPPPLFVTIGYLPSRSKQRRFCYFSRWLQHADFRQFIQNNWDTNIPISTVIDQFCKATDSWNRTAFGSFSRRKNHVMVRLRGIQRSLDQKRNAFLSQLEINVQLELKQILDQEEILWKQKSCCDWISFGDRNTTFFRRRGIINKRTNRISKLHLSTGEWCDDDDDDIPLSDYLF
ncbi:hypothetical protein V6N13_125027 [Hibiscus sabdariffa]